MGVERENRFNLQHKMSRKTKKKFKKWPNVGYNFPPRNLVFLPAFLLVICRCYKVKHRSSLLIYPIEASIVYATLSERSFLNWLSYLPPSVRFLLPQNPRCLFSLSFKSEEGCCSEDKTDQTSNRKEVEN